MEFAKRLTTKVLGVFLATLLAFMAAATPFNLLTFDWKVALVVAASAAVLAFVEGLAGRFRGDPEEPTLTR